MIRLFLTRFILPLVLFFFVRWALKSLFGSMRSAVTPTAESPRETPTAKTGGELKKDPVCGTYVSEGAAVTRAVKGNTLYFCSAACRDKYQA
jgi:YHS domain-containing protein